MKRLAAPLIFIVFMCPTVRSAVEPARAAGLLKDITRIAVIDHHSHNEAVSAARTEKWDLSRPLGTPPYAPVVRLRLNNPEWLRAWSALYGYPHADMNADHTRGLLETKLRIMREQGCSLAARPGPESICCADRSCRRCTLAQLSRRGSVGAVGSCRHVC